MVAAAILHKDAGKQHIHMANFGSALLHLLRVPSMC